LASGFLSAVFLATVFLAGCLLIRKVYRRLLRNCFGRQGFSTSWRNFPPRFNIC
jgi:hypothetical protein